MATQVLNLYAGIGGNRKLWEGVEVTAVEWEEPIAYAYSVMYPKDNVVIADAHKYLLEHFQEFDFVWSSPPCPTHSRTSTSLSGWGIHRYPDMKLYEEIIFLKHFFKGNWVVENVIPYYTPLITPIRELDRHLFWSNFPIGAFSNPRKHDVSRATKEVLAKAHGIELPPGTKDQRKLLRNAVLPELGLHVFNAAQGKSQVQVNELVALDLELL